MLSKKKKNFKKNHVERTVLQLKQRLFLSLIRIHEFLDSASARKAGIEMKEHTGRNMIAINKYGAREEVREVDMEMVGSAAQ